VFADLGGAVTVADLGGAFADKTLQRGAVAVAVAAPAPA